MKENKRAVIVGIFVLLGLAILIITILTLGSQKKLFNKSIQVKAIFNDVQGLSKGNNVWFSGVKIGTIKSIAFYGKSQVEVIMSLEEESAEYIRKDALAAISSDGFIGDKLISINGGTPKAGRIEDGDVMMVDEGGSTEEMMSTLQENNKNLLEITENFKTISARIAEGEGTVGKLLSDEQPFNDLQTLMVSLKETARRSAQISENLNAFAVKLNQPGGLANNLVTDTTVFARLKSTADEVEKLSREANAVVQELRQAGSTLNAGLNDPQSPMGVLLTDQKAADNIQGILINLESGSKKLDENLEALQHNFLLRGFFRKKQRAEENNK